MEPLSIVSSAVGLIQLAVTTSESVKRLYTVYKDSDHVREQISHELSSLSTVLREYKLWIDAISINPQEYTERGKNILRMDQLYGKLACKERAGDMLKEFAILVTISASSKEAMGVFKERSLQVLLQFNPLPPITNVLLRPDGTAIIVDRLSLSQEPKHRRYRALRQFTQDPWNTSFTSLFNRFSKNRIALLPQDPTLLQVLVHFNSIPPITHVLLGPDGTSLMSRESFLRVAPQLAKDVYGNSQENRSVYSNSVYILIGIFIEAISGDMLESVMKEYLFLPLNMERSFLGTPDSAVTGIALPYTMSVNGIQSLVNTQIYPVGNIMNAALGAWSCCRDLAILFRALLACINGDQSIFNSESIRYLLKPQAKLNQKAEDGFTICGICTTLDSLTVGSRSTNRLISPDKIRSTYRLGTRPNGKQVPAYYFASHIKGYSYFYFTPKYKSFVVVLTNSTARTDSSDHISRLLFHEIFDLEHTQRGLIPARKNNGTKQVDVVEMSRLAANERQILLEQFAAQDAQQDANGISPIQLQGTYLNKKTEHKIVIKSGDKLAYIVGTEVTATDSGFVKTNDMGIKDYVNRRSRDEQKMQQLAALGQVQNQDLVEEITNKAEVMFLRVSLAVKDFLDRETLSSKGWQNRRYASRNPDHGGLTSWFPVLQGHHWSKMKCFQDDSIQRDDETGHPIGLGMERAISDMAFNLLSIPLQLLEFSVSQILEDLGRIATNILNKIRSCVSKSSARKRSHLAGVHFSRAWLLSLFLWASPATATSVGTGNHTSGGIKHCSSFLDGLRVGMQELLVLWSVPQAPFPRSIPPHILLLGLLLITTFTVFLYTTIRSKPLTKFFFLIGILASSLTGAIFAVDVPDFVFRYLFVGTIVAWIGSGLYHQFQGRNRYELVDDSEVAFEEVKAEKGEVCY